MSRKRIVIPTVILLAVIAAGAFFFSRRDAGASDDLSASGTVEATEARLGFQSPGRITSIEVREGDRVAAAQVLARLDHAELDARLAQARARIASAAAQLAELQRGFRSEEIAQAEAAVSAARERLADARRDQARTNTLYEGGAVSPEARQKAATAAEIAEAQVRQASEQLLLLQRGPRLERIEAARAQQAEAQAAAEAVEAQLANAMITSPHPGVVTVRHREPNEIVSSGQPVVTVMNPGDRWVRIYVPEHRIGAVHVGDRASIRSDTFPDKSYRGAVTYISPEAEFTPKTVQTAEERVRLVYAVKVRIEGDPALELKPGMPADVVLAPAVPARG
jgi:HlyD family secretion protein